LVSLTPLGSTATLTGDYPYDSLAAAVTVGVWFLLRVYPMATPTGDYPYDSLAVAVTVGVWFLLGWPADTLECPW